MSGCDVREVGKVGQGCQRNGKERSDPGPPSLGRDRQGRRSPRASRVLRVRVPFETNPPVCRKRTALRPRKAPVAIW